jgi:hypothetical protein
MWSEWKMGSGDKEWMPKIISRYKGNEDNITCYVERDVDPIDFRFKNVSFSNHPLYTQTQEVTFTVVVGAKYRIRIAETKRPDPYVQKPVYKIGLMELKEGDNFINLQEGEYTMFRELTGTAFSLDGGDTWKPSFAYECDVTLLRDGPVFIPLLNREGRLNEKLAPRYVMVGDGFRISTDGGRFSFQKYNSAILEWEEVGVI